MKKLLLSPIFLLAVLGASAQKPINDANAQVRQVSGFRSVQVSGGIDLYLSQGSEAVAISAADDKMRDRIVTEVVNGVLKIHMRYDKPLHLGWRSGRNLRAYVSAPELEKLVAGGGSDVQVEGKWKAGKMRIDISGGADFFGTVEADELHTDASGGAEFHISGTASSLHIRASGGSDFRGYDMVADMSDIDASGGSDVSITANKELNVEASGGSDVYYRGTAVIRNIHSSGGGSVKKTSK